MAGRRVVAGQQNDGTMGLRISAPGIDAFVGDGQGLGFTFNSDWTDIVKIHQVGIGVETLVSNFWQIRISFPDLGYKPFCEARKLEGTTGIRDDYWGISDNASGPLFAAGAYHQLTSNTQFLVGISNAVGPVPSGTGYKALYIIYATPVLSG